MTLTRISKTWEITVFEDDGSTPFLTITTEVENPPQIGGQLVRPIDGRAEGLSWHVDVVDDTELITAKIADAGGRLHLIGRRARIREDRGSGFATLAWGRVQDVSLRPNVAAYRIRIADERVVERQTDIFGDGDGGTAMLFPIGMRYGWSYFRNDLRNVVLRSSAASEGREVETSGTDLHRIRLEDGFLNARIASWIEEQLVEEPEPARTDGEGNFEHIRLELDGTDYVVVSFAADVNSPDMTDDYQERGARGDDTAWFRMFVWIYNAGSLPAPANGSFYASRLHAPTAPASDTVPVHTGTYEISGGALADTAHKYTARDPIKLWQAIYDEIGVVYNAAAFAAFEGKFPKMFFRITSPQNAAAWIEDNICRPLNLIPFINKDGEVEPLSVALPSSDASDPWFWDHTSAFTFDVTNLRDHPTWEHTSSDLVTRIRFRYAKYRPAHSAAPGNPDEFDLHNPPPHPADMLVEEDVEDIRDHDRISSRGKAEKEITLFGFQRYHPWPGMPLSPEIVPTTPPQQQIDVLRHEIFQQYGDAPLRGRMPALSDAESVTIGDLVKINLDSFPNPANQARGGVRVVRIVNKEIDTTAGPTFEYLDVGPDNNPLADPSVAMAQITGDEKHGVEVTVSGAPAGADVAIRIGYGSTEPTEWPVIRIVDGNGTYEFREQPSGTKVWAQAQAREQGRISSAWSASASVTTASLTAPTLDSATVDGRSIILEWTNGHSNYRVMPVAAETPATPEDAESSPLPAGSGRYALSELAASTEHEVGVKHVGPFGGESAASTLTRTTGTDNALEDPRALRILQGRSDTAAPDVPEADRVGWGYELVFDPQERHARTRVQVATDSGFATVVQEFVLPAGERRFRVEAGPDDVTRFFRVRHERDGFSDSGWSSAVSSLSTALVREVGDQAQDQFPGGFAFLVDNGDGTADLVVGHGGDPDTDRAYYEAEVNPADPAVYPTVDENDSFVARADMPDQVEVATGLTDGDLVLVTVRFWNSVSGFGQDTRDRVTAARGELTLAVLLNATFPPIPHNSLNWHDWKVDVGGGVQSLNLLLEDDVGGVVERYELNVTPGETFRDLTENAALDEIDPTGNPKGLTHSDWKDHLMTLTPYDAVDGAQGTGTAGSPVVMVPGAGLVAPSGEGVHLVADAEPEFVEADWKMDRTEPASRAFLRHPGTGGGANQTAAFDTLIAADIPNLDASKITTGAFADARISQSSVTQHEGAINHDALSGFVANEHIDHTAVSISAGTGLSGGGTIAATRTINLSHLGIESLGDPNADRILFWDDSAGTTAWLSVGSDLTISTTTLSVNDSALSIAASQITSGTFGSGSYTFPSALTVNGTLTANAQFRHLDDAGQPAEMPRGMDGGYGDSQTAQGDFGSNIWSIGDTWAGTGSGPDFVVSGGSGQYGLVWLRQSHPSVNSFSSEGLHIYRAGSLVAAFGHAGAQFNVGVRIAGLLDMNADASGRVVLPVGADKWAT